MGKRMITYLLVLGAVGYLFLMYIYPALSGLLIFVLLYPAAGIVYLIFAGRGLSARVKRLSDYGEKEQQMKVSIQVCRESSLWIGKCRILLEMEHAAKETGKLLTVHQNRRWDDDFLIIKKLVEDGVVDGWDDPRLVSIAALRRRGFTPESIKKFVDLCGVSKANSSVDYAMLEYCIREDLKLKKARTMAVLNPVKLVIDNYPEDQIEMLEVQNNLENPELGSRQVPFGRELYIEREDFMEEPVRKYFRMFPGNEVRLMNAYFVTCTGCEKDENGNITVIHGTYDPESKGGNSPDGRKVKGTIHWVAAKTAVKAECRLYENLIDEEKGVYNEDGSMNLNPNSLTVLKECYLEPSLKDAKAYDSFQFVRNGFFCVDAKDSKEDALVFNRIVSLKSSFKLPAAK